MTKIGGQMDTTRKNNLMCEKAKEIQEEWNPQFGDYISVKWNKNLNSGGLEYTIIQLKPIYGVSFQGGIGLRHWNRNNCFYYHNGILFGKQVMKKMIDIEGFENIIWLPRQDRLQAMLGLNAKQLVITFNYWWTDDYNPIPGKEFTSMEQLWLAFVMKKKYQKIWSGTDWVKEAK